MAKNITFHLPVCAVHSGVDERQSALIAADALAQIRAKPLLPRCECRDVRPQQQLSMRFPPQQSEADARPSATPALSFASMFAGPLATTTVDAALTGLAAADVVGKKLVEVAVAEEHRGAMERLLSSGDEQEVLLRLQAAGGGEVEVAVTLSSFGEKGASGDGASGVLGVGVDITKLSHSASAALQEAHELKRLIDCANGARRLGAIRRNSAQFCAIL